MRYDEYLQSDEWKTRRAQARQRAKNRCEHCGGSPDHVHHVRYPKNFKDDVLENLIVVCESCHMKHHGIRGKEMTNAVIVQFEGFDVCAVDVNGQKWARFADVQRTLGMLSAHWSTAQRELDDDEWALLTNPCTLQNEPFLSPDGVLIVGMRFGMNDRARKLRKHLAGMATGKNQQAMTLEDQIYMNAVALRAHRTEIDAHDKRIAALEDHERKIIERIQSASKQLEQRISRTVAAPGQFSIRAYCLMIEVDPEMDIGGKPLKVVLGGVCREIGKRKGIRPGKQVEGSFEVNTWPANVIDEGLQILNIDTHA